MSKFIHPSVQHGFSHDTTLSSHTHPSYPNDIHTWLAEQITIQPKSKVVDLGAGTGKFTPYLSRLTPHVFAVEPIEEMLDQLTATYPDIHTIQSDSHNLNLPSHSIDAVLCAQSFHWFADAQSLDEIYHVLKPHGALGLVWNQRDISIDWVKEVARVLQPLEKNIPRFHSGTWQDAFADNNQFQLISTQSFPFSQRGTVEQVLINRILSTSFIATRSAKEQVEITNQLLEITKNYLGKDLHDEIEFPYITYAYHYQKC